MTRSKTSFPYFSRIQIFGPFKAVTYMPDLRNTCSSCLWIIPGTIGEV